MRLTRRFNDLVLSAGGRFYFAKDSVVDGASVRASLGDDLLQRFFALKRRVDPEELLSNNLYRRIFGSIRPALPLYPNFEAAERVASLEAVSRPD